MIDVHCHILPGLDDGAKDLEESLAMARVLAANGFQGVIATSHVVDREGYRNTREGILTGVRALTEALAAENIALQVYPGAEYHLHRAVPDLARQYFPLATLAGSLYLLVELPVMNLPSYLSYSSLPMATDLPELKKILPFLRPVIAHPERNQEVLRDHRRLHKLRESGYLFQVNLESIIGWEGKNTQAVIKQMARENLIDLIGTDGHTKQGLEKLLPGWRKQVEKILGRERAGLVLDDNPQRVLTNEPIDWED